MTQRILVAVDDSPRSIDVAAAAVELSVGRNVSMRLYRAVNIPPEFPPAAATAAGDPLPVYLQAEAKRHLQTLADRFRDVTFELEVEVAGTPWRAILNAGERYAADLIVIGSHGFDALDRLLGTTAARVVNVATRDVLVVHRKRPQDA